MCVFSLFIGNFVMNNTPVINEGMGSKAYWWWPRPPPPPPPPPPMNTNCSPPHPIFIADGRLLPPGAYASVDHDCQTCNRNGMTCSNLTKSQAAAEAAAAAERARAAAAAAAAAAAQERAREAERQRIITRKKDTIRGEKDYNIYFTESVVGSRVRLFQGNTIKPGANNIVSFTINFKGVNRGHPNTGNWNQIIGLTTNYNGGDQRYLGVWICPGTNTLHIRTETEANGNDNISDCNRPLSPGIHRIDIIGITNDNLTQTYWAYDNGQLFANVNISGKQESGYNNPVYAFSSFSNFNHVSELGHNVSRLVVMTGNGNRYNPQTIVDGLNAFNDLLNRVRA